MDNLIETMDKLVRAKASLEKKYQTISEALLLIAKGEVHEDIQKYALRVCRKNDIITSDTTGL